MQQEIGRETGRNKGNKERHAADQQALLHGLFHHFRIYLGAGKKGKDNAAEPARYCIHGSVRRPKLPARAPRRISTIATEIPRRNEIILAAKIRRPVIEECYRRAWAFSCLGSVGELYTRLA